MRPREESEPVPVSSASWMIDLIMGSRAAEEREAGREDIVELYRKTERSRSEASSKKLNPRLFRYELAYH